MEINKITKKDSSHIDWLLQQKNHSLDTYGLSEVVKILIEKVNQLIDEREGKETPYELSNCIKPAVMQCSHGRKYFIKRTIGGYMWCPDCRNVV